MNGICLHILSGCALTLSLVTACHAPTAGHDSFVWSDDSVKRALYSGTLHGRAEMMANGQLGIHYIVSGRYDSARLYLRRALDMPGGRELQGGRLITNLANAYGYEGRYVEAMELYMDALEVSERLVATGRDVAGGEANTVRTAANLAELFHNIGNRERALHYATVGRRLLESGRTPSVHYIEPQLLWVSGAVLLERGELDGAADAMAETNRVADSLARRSLDGGDPAAGGLWWYSAYGREGEARVALAKGDTDTALRHAEGALRYARMHGDSTVVAKVMMAFSDIHLARGDHAAGGRYARGALEIFPGYLELNPDAAFNIATDRLMTGDRAGALDWFRLYAARIKDNTDKQFRQTMAGMEVIYDTEKKETRIAALENQRRLYVAIGAAGLLCAVSIWLFLRQRIKNERRERQLVAANAVLEWEKRERKRFASDLHDGINGMLSAIRFELGAAENMQNVRDRLDECIDAIRAMSRSRMPTSLQRYGMRASLEDYCRLFPNVDFHFFGRDCRLDEKLELTVYYCAYELVNNAFRHSGAKTIDVQLVQDGGSVSLTVQDDGCGFDERAVKAGGGLGSIRDRVASLDGAMDVTSSPGRGTEINIEFRER